MFIMKKILGMVEKIFDAIQHRWESPPAHKVWGTALVVFFVVSYIITELWHWHLLPESLGHYIPHSRLAIVELAFTLTLIVEVISLVFSLAHSVASSVGKQFEVLSLIFLRDVFKEFSHLHEPFQWEEISTLMPTMLVVAISALLIFFILGYYYKSQQHRPLTTDENEQRSFIQMKKLVALILLLSFSFYFARDLWRISQQIEILVSPFESFYTLLLFSDVFIVLLSLRYGSRYHIAFRNSGFAVATVLIRLSLIAPLMIGAALGVATTLFALGVTLAYNNYVPVNYPDTLRREVDYL